MAHWRIERETGKDVRAGIIRAVRERFAEHLAQSGLIPHGATVVLGYSGGADSTCLLSLLAHVGVDVIAAHLHHGLRSEADDELDRCRRFCEELDVPFMSGRADVARIAEDRKVGYEEAGREARYAFFEQCLSSTNAALIATAHTLDDHVETVLFNLARGSGMRGLAGIPESSGHIVRPLLPFLRTETRVYCLSEKLWFHDDPANEETGFARVKLRKFVVPVIAEINSSARQNIARSARTLREEDRFLDGMAAAGLERAEMESACPLSFLYDDVYVAFDRNRLTELPRVLLCRGLRLVTATLGAALDHDQTNSIVESLEKETQKGSVTAEGGKVVVEWGTAKFICRSLEEPTPLSTSVELPGETTSKVSGWRLSARTTTAADLYRPPLSLDVVIGTNGLKAPFHLRTGVHQETMLPFKASNQKKISELLADIGVPEPVRKRIPILCDLIGPVWVPGSTIAERAKVSPSEAKCVHLTFGPIRT